MGWFRSPPEDMRSLMQAAGFRGGDRPIELFA
jgi:hypothetical protein